MIFPTSKNCIFRYHEERTLMTTHKQSAAGNYSPLTNAYTIILHQFIFIHKYKLLVDSLFAYLTSDDINSISFCMYNVQCTYT